MAGVARGAIPVLYVGDRAHVVAPAAVARVAGPQPVAALPEDDGAAHAHLGLARRTVPRHLAAQRPSVTRVPVVPPHRVPQAHRVEGNHRGQEELAVTPVAHHVVVHLEIRYSIPEGSGVARGAPPVKSETTGHRNVFFSKSALFFASETLEYARNFSKRRALRAKNVLKFFIFKRAQKNAIFTLIWAPFSPIFYTLPDLRALCPQIWFRRPVRPPPPLKKFLARPLPEGLRQG